MGQKGSTEEGVKGGDESARPGSPRGSSREGRDGKKRDAPNVGATTERKTVLQQKVPQQLTVERGEGAKDSHAVMEIPKTKFKIVYVDANRRGDVVAPHGYVALSKFSSGRNRSGSTSLAGQQSSAYFSGANEDKKRKREGDDVPEGLPQPNTLPPPAVPMPDGTADALDIPDEDSPGAADRRKSEGLLSTDPSKSGVMSKSGISRTDVNVGSMNTPREVDPTVAGEEIDVQDPFAAADANADAIGGSNQGSDDQLGGIDDPFASNGPAPDGNGLDAAEEENPLMDTGAPEPPKEEEEDDGFTYGAKPRDSRSSSVGSGILVGAAAAPAPEQEFYDATTDLAKQIFFYPKGQLAQNRVYFYDEAANDDRTSLSRHGTTAITNMHLEPSVGSRQYEVEEDEIHEMAGVHRMTPRVKGDHDDVLATYEPKSGVLEALWMAIDAPIDDLRVQDILAEGGDQTDEELKAFREEAMKQAKDMFADTEEEILGMTRADTRLGAGALAATFASTRLMGTKSFGGTGGRSPNGTLGGTTGSGGGGTMYNIDTHGADGMPLDDEDIMRQKVNARKKYHKLLNKWKASFQEKEGRAPEGHELASDPEIRDVYSAYRQLKKETKEKKDVEEASPTNAADVSDASPGGGEGVSDITLAAQMGQLPDVPDHRNSLAPIGDPAQLEADRKANKKELKSLQKQVKAWKKEFKANEGRAPTKKDIRSDDVVGPAYERVKELEAWFEANGGQGDDSHSDREGADNAAGPPEGGLLQPLEAVSPGSGSQYLGTGDVDVSTDPRRASGPTSPSTISMNPEEVAAALQRVEDEEGLDRREFEADEDIEFRGIQRRSDSEKPAGLLAMEQEKARSVINLDATGSNVDVKQVSDADMPMMGVNEGFGLDETVRQVGDDSASNGMLSKTATVTFGGNEYPEHATMDPKDLAKRRKKLAKELNAWKTKFAEENGREPTIKDIKNSPEIASVYDEYSKIPKDVGKQAGGLEGFSAFGDTMAGGTLGGGALADAVAAEEKQLAKRRKQLAKELNAWKTKFAEENGREPTTKDIMGDPEAAAVYQEYSELKKAKSGDDGASNIGGPGGTLSSGVAMALMGLGGSSATMANDTTFRVARDASPAPGAASTTDLAANKKRRKALGKQLNEWKKAFAEANDRQPTTRDIKEDVTIGAVFDEYNNISKDGEILNTNLATSSGGAAAGDGSEGASPTAPNAPEDPAAAASRERAAELKTLRKQKKKLGKELNAWKKSFEEDWNRKPKIDDIKGDAKISVVYEEYNALGEKEKALEAAEAGTGFGSGDEANPEDSSPPAVSSPTTAGPAEGEELHEGNAAEGRPSIVAIPAALDSGALLPSAQSNPEVLDPKEHKKLKKQKKELKERLKIFQAEFEAENGRKPKANDYNNDPEMAAVKADYEQVSQQLESAGEQRSVSPGPRSREQSVAPPEEEKPDPAALAARRKELGKILNKWKGDFKVRTGEHPTKKDIEDDEEIRPLFEEYQSIPKNIEKLAEEGGEPTDGSPSFKSGTNLSAGPGFDEDTTPSVRRSRTKSMAETLDEDEAAAMKERKKMLKEQKKEMAKKLNAWKASFTEANGRGPKKADIQNDEDVALLYEELEAVKEQLEEMKDL